GAVPGGTTGPPGRGVRKWALTILPERDEYRVRHDADGRGPAHRRERPDDEPLRRDGVLAQLGVAPEALDRHDERDPAGLAREEAARDREPLEDADPRAAAQRLDGLRADRARRRGRRHGDRRR